MFKGGGGEILNLSPALPKLGYSRLIHSLCFPSPLCHCLLLRRGSLNHCHSSGKAIQTQSLRLEGRFFFFFLKLFLKRLRKKALFWGDHRGQFYRTHARAMEDFAVVRVSKGTGHVTVWRSGPHAAAAGERVAGRAAARAVPGRPGRRGPVGPSCPVALPAALKAPTMQRWRPSSVTRSLPAPANPRGAGGGAGERRL